MIVNVEVDIARPRHQVFDLMADARNELEWNSKVSRSELISDEPIGKWTEFTTTNRGQQYVAFITTYDRPDQVGFNVVGKALEINASMRFADSADGPGRSVRPAAQGLHEADDAVDGGRGPQGLSEAADVVQGFLRVFRR